jgi:hypothetical protein
MRVPGDHRHDVGRVAEARGHGAGIAQAERVDAAMAEPDGRVVPADERRDPRSLREAGLQERDALGLEFALERALDEAVQEHDGGGTVGEGLADDLQLVMRIALDHVARDGDRVERERGLPEVVDDVEEPRSRLLRAIQMGVAEVRDQRHEHLPSGRRPFEQRADAEPDPGEANAQPQHCASAYGAATGDTK